MKQCEAVTGRHILIQAMPSTWRPSSRPGLGRYIGYQRFILNDLGENCAARDLAHQKFWLSSILKFALFRPYADLTQTEISFKSDCSLFKICGLGKTLSFFAM